MYYKNVDIDICDLENIINQGILPISQTGNDNWEDGNRSDNSKDVVYLFKPTGIQNTFVNYGLALIEIIDDIKPNKSTLEQNDVNIGKYNEYTISEIKPQQINKIYIPSIFKNRITINDPKKIIEYVNTDIYKYAEPASGRIDLLFNGRKYNRIDQKDITLLQNSPINTNEYCYLRGVDEKRIVHDYFICSYHIPAISKLKIISQKHLR